MAGAGRKKQVATSCGPEEAERFLNSYLGTKHDLAGQLRRPIDEMPIDDVISVYLDDVVTASARVAQGVDCAARLSDRWSGKALSGVSLATCGAYVENRATAESTIEAMIYLPFPPLRPRLSPGSTSAAEVGQRRP